MRKSRVNGRFRLVMLGGVSIRIAREGDLFLYIAPPHPASARSVSFTDTRPQCRYSPSTRPKSSL